MPSYLKSPRKAGVSHSSVPLFTCSFCLKWFIPVHSTWAPIRPCHISIIECPYCLHLYLHMVFPTTKWVTWDQRQAFIHILYSWPFVQCLTHCRPFINVCWVSKSQCEKSATKAQTEKCAGRRWKGQFTGWKVLKMDKLFLAMQDNKAFSRWDAMKGFWAENMTLAES